MTVTPISSVSSPYSRRRGAQHRYLTFLRLTQMGNKELSALFAQGQSPALADLEGWEFRGCNITPITRLMGIRKFRKGFLRSHGEHGPDELLGYNVMVRQNALRAPHLAVPNELEAIRHGYFLVQTHKGQDIDPHKDAIFLDYGSAPVGSKFHPGRVLRDFVVQVDPENPDLLLGKAYAKVGVLTVFVSFFVLERYNRIGR